MNTRKLTTIGALAFAVAAGSSARAGIKYWDNPAYRAFDVGDYVQSDLIWNYDGIRNVGADAAHDPNALTWANFGSFGSANDAVLRPGPPRAQMGAPPHLVRAGRAHVELALDPAADGWRCYALSQGGRRLAEVPASRTGNGRLELDLDNAAESATLFWELVRP